MTFPFRFLFLNTMRFFILERDFKIRNWDKKSLAIFKHVKWEFWDSYQGSKTSFLT